MACFTYTREKKKKITSAAAFIYKGYWLAVAHAAVVWFSSFFTFPVSEKKNNRQTFSSVILSVYFVAVYSINGVKCTNFILKKCFRWLNARPENRYIRSC